MLLVHHIFINPAIIQIPVIRVFMLLCASLIAYLMLIQIPVIRVFMSNSDAFLFSFIQTPVIRVFMYSDFQPRQRIVQYSNTRNTGIHANPTHGWLYSSIDSNTRNKGIHATFILQPLYFKKIQTPVIRVFMQILHVYFVLMIGIQTPVIRVFMLISNITIIS